VVENYSPLDKEQKELLVHQHEVGISLDDEDWRQGARTGLQMKFSQLSLLVLGLFVAILCTI
jgi:hypothetical protein